MVVREDEVGSGLGVPGDSDGDDRLGEGFGGFSFKEFCEGRRLGNTFLTLEIPESSHATKYWCFSSDKLA